MSCGLGVIVEHTIWMKVMSKRNRIRINQLTDEEIADLINVNEEIGNLYLVAGDNLTLFKGDPELWPEIQKLALKHGW